MKIEEAYFSKRRKYPNDLFGYFLDLTVVCLAAFGGLVLIAIVSINFLSVLGRLFFFSSMVGDFELVEMGCAVAVAAFLPLCFMRKGNVIVDFVTASFPSWMTGCLDILGSLIFGLVAGFFGCRMCLGLRDMMHYKEETMLLQIPVWIPFLPVIFSFFVLSICCFYVAGRDARELLLKV